MKTNRYILCFAIFALSCLKMSATHIVGGNLNYEYLGKDPSGNGDNQYKIILQLMRDCQGIGFDGNVTSSVKADATVGIFGTSDLLRIKDVTFKFNGETRIGDAVYEGCTTPPASSCYLTTTYTTIVSLPPRVGGYTLHYQRCCRNQLIVNVENPLCTGITYAAFIPGSEIAGINSNPLITKWPETTINSRKLWSFDGSAKDLDGDSLIYELYHPYEGLNYDCGMIGGARSPSAGRPSCASAVPPLDCNTYSVSVAPPFKTLTWKAPYSLNNMLGGSLPLQIDRFTGKITANPDQFGSYVIGWKVKEYRRGKLIGETLRDYQLIVVPGATVCDMVAGDVYCNTKTVTFDNRTSGDYTFKWNFGDLTTDTDVSTEVNPSYTYSTFGVYTVTLEATSTLKPCKETATRVVNIIDGIKSNFSYSASPICSNVYSFHANTLLGNVETNWSFGDGTSEENILSPVHSYSAQGIYTVTLTSQVRNGVGCSPSVISKNVQVQVKSICGFVGISEQILNATLSIYPNPNKGLFSIQSDTKIAGVFITNVLGETVYKNSSVQNSKIELDLSTYSKGIYFVHITDEANRKANQKVIIE